MRRGNVYGCFEDNFNQSDLASIHLTYEGGGMGMQAPMQQQYGMPQQQYGMPVQNQMSYGQQVSILSMTSDALHTAYVIDAERMSITRSNIYDDVY